MTIIELNSDDDRQTAIFEAIQAERGFISQWGLYDVTDLSAKCGFSVNSLRYGTFTINLRPVWHENNLTWIELWRLSDCLILLNELDGLTIRDFTEIGDGIFELETALSSPIRTPIS